METKDQKQKKIYMGKVISDKMDKTIVVETVRTFTHPTFHKTMHHIKNYKVHDENKQAKTGDMVEFYEGRPVSKTKYMYLSRVVEARAVKS